MFQPSQELLKEWAFGAKSQRPIRIFASVNTRSFGEFILRLLYVNSVAEQFDNRDVTLLYRNDTDFKSALVKLLPEAHLIKVPGNAYLPNLDILSPRNIQQIPGLEGWTEYEQDLVITEGMATEVGLLGFERLGYLRFPEELATEAADHLMRRGIDPDGWFVTMHARESGYYTAAKNTHRNADLEAYRAAMEHIFALGGNVVRLGHPEMTRFGPRPGLLELGLEPDTALLQAFAVSRSRYMLAGPSGPMALAEAFHVPTAYANSWDLYLCNDRAVVRTNNLIKPSGEVLTQRNVIEAITHGHKPLFQAGWRVEQIPPQEMIRLVNVVHRETENCRGWRCPDPPYSGPRPNQLKWPGELRSKARYLEDYEQ